MDILFLISIGVFAFCAAVIVAADAFIISASKASKRMDAERHARDRKRIEEILHTN